MREEPPQAVPKAVQRRAACDRYRVPQIKRCKRRRSARALTAPKEAGTTAAAGVVESAYGLARKTSRQLGSQRATTSANPSGLGPCER